jgi:hypothetical protein
MGCLWRTIVVDLNDRMGGLRSVERAPPLIERNKISANAETKAR